MSIENKDLKYLNNNDYDRIMIIEEKLNTSYSLNILKSKEKCEKQLSLEPNSFSEKIKDLSENQKVEQIIYQFLKSNPITSISNNHRISNYPYLFNLIKGDNASLAVRLFCDKQILSKCWSKYELDRYDYLNHEKDVIWYEIFSSENTSSYTEELYFGQRVIQLTLIKKDEKLWWKDEKFLKTWLIQKLEEQGKYAECNIDKEVDIPKLSCGDLIVLIPDELIYKKINKVVKQYNKSLENQKKLQLKLEVL